MRTTVTLDPDVAAAVENVRRQRHVGDSAAVNALVRAGLAQAAGADPPFEQRTSSMEARIDVANIGDALELLDGSAAR